MVDSPRNIMFQEGMVSLSLRASIAGSLAVVAILSLSGLSLAQSLSPQASVVHRSVPRIRALTDGTATSTNWSGYAVTGAAGSVTDAKGSWIVPSVTCSSAASYSSFWVGIDGFGSNTVEQTGTDSDCQSGSPTYYAWYEFYPGPGLLITDITVRPGDHLSAEAVYSTTGLVTVTITDATTAQPFTTSGGGGALGSSAEWIAEAPSSAGGVLPLANFETAYLGQDNTGLSPTNYATVSGVTGPTGSFGPSVQEITMVSSSGTTEAQPSPLSTDGTSFSVAWSGSPTSTTSSATTTATTTVTTTSTTSSSTTSTSTSTTSSSSSSSATTTTTSTSATSTTTGANGVSNLTINSMDTTGAALAGYWTALSQNGQELANGYTPATYTLSSGQTYTLEADGYASCSFDHWLDTNSPNNLRDVSITSDTSLTAVLNCGNTVTTTTTTTATTTTSTTSTTTTTLAASSQISVSTVNSAGAPIDGYYTTLWQNGVMLQWCYSPCSFVVSNGQTYQVAVADYGGEAFSHWSDGTTNTFHTVTLGSISITFSLTAVYTP